MPILHPNRFDGYNRLLMTDSYNLSHQFLKINTDWEVSHIYNRKEYRGAGMIVFGLHQIVNELLDFRVTEDMVLEAEFYANKNNLVFPRELWMRVVDELDGKIPLRVQMVPEGTYVPVGTPYAQVRNTVEGFGELVTWWEALFLHSWFPSACATEAFHMRRHLQSKVPVYGETILFKYHSFGFRGHASILNAREAGSAWNLFLFGTDDFHTNEITPKANIGSIAALAHKVTQQYEDEYQVFIHAIDVAAETGKNIVALVIDTYNADNVIDNWVVSLGIYAKSKGVHIIFRPDSGKKRLIVGLEEWQDIAWQVIRIYRLITIAGLTNVTCIVGEGQSLDNAQQLESYLEMHGVPFSFCYNGIGGGFYKDLNRDTHGLAMKTAFSNGKPRAKVVLSNPFKSSIPGIVALVMENGEMVVKLEEDVNENDNIYVDVYNYDAKISVRFMPNPNWDKTQIRALSYLDKDLPNRIKISAKVIALFDEIKNKHITMGVA